MAHGVTLSQLLFVNKSNKEIVEDIAKSLELHLLEKLFNDWIEGIDNKNFVVINIKDFWEIIEANGGRRNEVYFIRATKEKLAEKGWRIEKMGNWYVFKK